MFLLLDAEISDSATVSSPGFHPFNLWLFLISNANPCCTRLLSSAKKQARAGIKQQDTGSRLRFPNEGSRVQGQQEPSRSLLWFVSLGMVVWLELCCPCLADPSALAYRRCPSAGRAGSEEVAPEGPQPAEGETTPRKCPFPLSVFLEK